MKITIRPLEQRDAYISWKWRNDPEVFANTVRHYSGPVTLEDELKWINEVLARPDERRFAILSDDVYVGNVYLTGITPTEAEIGIFIGNKNYWKKNIGTAAYEKIFEIAFKEIGLLSLKCSIRPENKASIRLNEKMGFVPMSRDNDYIYYIKRKDR